MPRTLAPEKSLHTTLQRLQAKIDEKKREIADLERRRQQIEEAIQVLSK